MRGTIVRQEPAARPVGPVAKRHVTHPGGQGTLPDPVPREAEPTPAEIWAVRALYLQLVAAEPNGRHRARRIAQRLGVPNALVQAIVAPIRTWRRASVRRRPARLRADLLERVRALYLPLLPLPPIGCHRDIAEQLHERKGRVRYAITIIRHQRGLPPWSDRDEDGGSSACPTTRA